MIKLYISLFLICANLHALRLDVLSLNTWMLPFAARKVKTRLVRLKKEVKKYDIVSLQEIFRGRKRRQVINSLDDGIHYVYSTGSFPLAGSGLLNISKYKIKKTYFYPFQKCGGFQCLAKKGVLYTLIKLNDKISVNVFNLHLQAYGIDNQIRKRQFKTLKYALKMQENNYPTVVMGDFNIIAKTPEYRLFMKELSGFRDSWLELRPNDPGFSWNQMTNYYARRFSKVEYPMEQRLDYIFIKDGKKYKINALDIKLIGKDFPVADHYGVNATLDIL